jgi:hypothetical protein
VFIFVKLLKEAVEVIALLLSQHFMQQNFTNVNPASEQNLDTFLGFDDDPF